MVAAAAEPVSPSADDNQHTATAAASEALAMKLSAYRARIGIPQRAAADWVGVTHRTIARWEKGASMPRPAHQRRIQKLTKGKVTPNDWLGPSGRQSGRA